MSIKKDLKTTTDKKAVEFRKEFKKLLEKYGAVIWFNEDSLGDNFSVMFNEGEFIDYEICKCDGIHSAIFPYDIND